MLCSSDVSLYVSDCVPHTQTACYSDQDGQLGADHVLLTKDSCRTVSCSSDVSLSPCMSQTVYLTHRRRVTVIKTGSSGLITYCLLTKDSCRTVSCSSDVSLSPCMSQTVYLIHRRRVTVIKTGSSGLITYCSPRTRVVLCHVAQMSPCLPVCLRLCTSYTDGVCYSDQDGQLGADPHTQTYRRAALITYRSPRTRVVLCHVAQMSPCLPVCLRLCTSHTDGVLQ